MNAKSAGLKRIKEEAFTLNKYLSARDSLKDSEIIVVCSLAIDILESAFLISPQETSIRLGQMLAGHLLENSGFCINCGCKAKGLCKKCETKTNLKLKVTKQEPRNQ